MNRETWNGLSDEQRRRFAERIRPARVCSARGCTDPAGTPWSSTLCYVHDAARVSTIVEGARELRRRLRGVA